MTQAQKLIDLAPYLERPTLTDRLSREGLATLLEQIKALEGRVMSRLLVSAPGQSAAISPPANDRMLTVDEAAERLRRRPSWIYRHSAHLPFVVKRAPRSRLLCSERGIQQYLARR